MILYNFFTISKGVNLKIEQLLTCKVPRFNQTIIFICYFVINLSKMRFGIHKDALN